MVDKLGMESWVKDNMRKMLNNHIFRKKELLDKSEIDSVPGSVFIKGQIAMLEELLEIFRD